MARYKLPSCLFTDQSGNAVESGTCAVYLAGTTTAASIYAASAGGVAVNSVTSSSTGQCTWYVDTADYATSQKFKIIMSKTDFTPQTYDDIVVFPEVTLTGTETLTNKTLTSPAITTPTTITRTSQQYLQTVAHSKVGATAGWNVATAANTNIVDLPASQTGSTLVVPVTIPLKIGYTITAFSVQAQIESAGNTVTLDADLRKMTVAAADHTDASVGAITQISVTADTAVSTSKTGLAEVVAANESFYFLVTGTTAAATDIALTGFTITVSEL